MAANSPKRQNRAALARVRSPRRLSRVALARGAQVARAAAVRRSTFRKNEARKPKADDKKRFPRGESRKRTTNGEKCRVQERGYRSIPGIFLCPLSAVDCRSFLAFCRLTPTRGVFCRRLFASGCGLSFIFSFLPPDAYAWRFLSSTFRFRMRCVTHFQLFAACRLRTAFFVVDFSLPDAVCRSFSAFCHLTRTHVVFSLLVFRFRLPRAVHFRLFSA